MERVGFRRPTLSPPLRSNMVIVITNEGVVKQLSEKEAKKLVDSGLACAVARKEKLTNDVEKKHDN
jgi:hypothetical protein